MKVAQLLGLQGPWQRQVCKDTECLPCGSYVPIRVFFRASCSWRSKGLFGQSISVAPPVQALRGLLCLGSFSVVWHIRHIEGLSWLGFYSVNQHVPGTLRGTLSVVLLCSSAHQSLKGAPWVGSCSVVHCGRRLMSQPLYSSAADAGVWGERGYGDGYTPYA